MLEKTQHYMEPEGNNHSKNSRLTYMIVAIFLCVFILENEERFMVNTHLENTAIKQSRVSKNPIKDILYSLLNISDHYK